VDDMAGREPREGGIDQIPVSHATDNEREPGQRGQCLGHTGGEVIDDQNFVSLRKICLDEIGADAAGAAGDQDPHEFCSARRWV
jgi:hypothetical protein